MTGLADSIGPNYIPPSGKEGTDIPYEYTTVDKLKTSKWKIADSIRVSQDRSSLTTQQISSIRNYLSKNFIVTDYGFLRDMHGETVLFNNWFIMWAVCSPKNNSEPSVLEWTNVQKYATLKYFYSQDGMNWQYGGNIIPTTSSIYPQHGRCSMVMREGTSNTVDVFYSCYDYTNNTTLGYNSRTTIASSTGQITTNNGAVLFSGFTTSTEMFKTDGIKYNSLQENDNFIIADPYPFINPGDGNVYCLFVCNLPGIFGKFVIDDDTQGYIPPYYTISEDAVNKSSVIGIAQYNTNSYASGDFSSANWTLLNPLLSCLGVSSKVERPHFFFDGAYTYLLFSNTYENFTNGYEYPTGLYGMYSTNGIFGPYYTLNGSGQVLTNPSTGPDQANSFFCDDSRYIYSYIYSIQEGSETNFGGTMAPTNQIVFNKKNTFLQDVLNYGLANATIDWNTIYTTYGGNSAPWIRS